MNKSLELVKKFLADPLSVSQEELKANAKDAYRVAITTDTLSTEYAYAAALGAFSAASYYDGAIAKATEAVSNCEEALAKEATNMKQQP